MHNALFHLSSNIKALAAARLGAPQMDSPGMREGLPMLEIFHLDQAGERQVVAKVDGVDGLQVISQSQWAALDEAKAQGNQSTALLSSFAEWLVFLHHVLAVKDDMEVQLLDAHASLPLMQIADNDYVTAAPWVTTSATVGSWASGRRSAT